MPHDLAFRAHDGLFVTNMAVGINFNLHPAIAEDTLGHDGDHIDIVNLLADDKRRRLVIGVGGSSADCGDKLPARLDYVAVPRERLVATVEKRNRRHAAFDHGQRIEPDQIATLVGIAITGARFPFSNKTQHRTGIAANLHSFDGQLISHIQPLSMPYARVRGWPARCTAAPRSRP